MKLSDWNQVELVAPYLYLTKGDIVREGMKLGVDYTLTHTCYNGVRPACGKCGSCSERILAFHENKAIDPIMYAAGWTASLEAILNQITCAACVGRCCAGGIE